MKVARTVTVILAKNNSYESFNENKPILNQNQNGSL